MIAMFDSSSTSIREVSRDRSDSNAVPRYSAELDAPSALRAAHKLLIIRIYLSQASCVIDRRE